MLRTGKLCQSCNTAKCQINDGDPNKTRRVICPNCEGTRCELCDGTGSFELVGCPHEFIAGVAESIPFIDMFENGMPPVDGGTLKQTAWFIRAAQYLIREDNRILNEK